MRRARAAMVALGLCLAGGASATVLPVLPGDAAPGVTPAATTVPKPNPRRAAAPAEALRSVAPDRAEWPRRVAGVPVPQPRPLRGQVVGRVKDGRVVASTSAFAARTRAGPVAELFEAAEEAAEGAGTLAARARGRQREGPSLFAGYGGGPDTSPFSNHGRRTGSLKAALDALRADRYEEVLARRNALKDPLDRKIVDYYLVRAGTEHLTAAMVADFAARAEGWPSETLFRTRAEEALSRERPSADAVLSAMDGSAVSAAGVRLLARAHLEKGDKARARELVRGVWHERVLGTAMQAAYIDDFAPILTVDDHLTRADKLIAENRLSEARRLRRRLGSGPRAYLDARLAAASGRGNARRLLERVPGAYRRRPGYRLAEIEVERRDDNWQEAARLIESAPRNGLVVGDAWWVEARIVARGLVERGRGRRAYGLVTRGFAQGRVERADEAFHAGWIALTHLKDGRRADKHFARLARIATTPISSSRAAYWRGRAAVLRGEEAAAERHYRDAARHGFTYYGQLARAELGLSGTGVPRGPRVTAADRAAMAKNELAEAIRRLVATDHAHRIWPLLEHLAETVPTAGQLALVADLAEEAGYDHLALLAAKEGQRRGLDVGRLAYPTDAIPRSARIPKGLDRALVYAIARQESLFNEAAVSPAGARGLMQVMPRTAAAMARELGVGTSERRLVTDPAHNAELGAAYLAKRLDNFGGSYILTFAAYNAGAGRVREWIERFGDPREDDVDPIQWVESIPYPETRNYVQRVMENVQVYREALGTGGLAIGSDLARGRAG